MHLLSSWPPELLDDISYPADPVTAYTVKRGSIPLDDSQAPLVAEKTKYLKYTSCLLGDGNAYG